jgi:hypothetical protein
VDQDQLRRRLNLAHSEALKVGDSPLRADRVADQLQVLVRELGAAELDDDRRARLSAALENAMRVLRRDDDGREAAKHLQAALRLLEAREKKPSPFLDD